ncbi:MAG: hypothetical protein AMK69_29185 [Nitrospira bacterium SG8_3]|nr:MAG: hypothetical protein AMK69_29185 [Nitrospira bacterium SG8_3]
MSWHRLTMILVALFLVGCSPKIAVRIDSIVAQGTVLQGRNYILYSGMTGTSVDDLYFREYGTYFLEVLKRNGYRQVNQPEDADLAIYFSYGITGGTEVHYTYTRPVYAIVGGETVDIRETETDAAGGKIKTTKTVTIPSTSRVVGVETRRESYTVFTAHAVLEAKEIHGTKAQTDNSMQTLWQTTITTTSKLDDLRRIMPVMAAASVPFVGKNTGEIVTVKLRDRDAQVLDMKRLR